MREVLTGSAGVRSASNSAGFDLVPGLEEYALGVNFGEIWSRPQLDVKTRCGITLAALTALGVAGLTAIEVKGFGRQRGHTEIYRGAEYNIHFLPKIKVEVAVPDELAERAVEAIREAAATGQIGDGKIFVVNLEQALRIRTGESGNEAL